VLEAACRQARAWRDGAVGNVAICVNLSASQLRDAGLVADLRKMLERTGCEADWLEFEITETSMVRDVEGASLVLAKLRALGVRIAIDDFGTGFSSLSHLRHLPVDVLKVDRAFVADIEPSPGARRRGESAGGAAIVSAVIGLARGLGLGVVAEGVEKQSQLDFLAREGCSHCQGYLVCPPMAAEDFENWLVARRKPRKGPRSQAPGARKKPKSKTAARRNSSKSEVAPGSWLLAPGSFTTRSTPSPRREANPRCEPRPHAIPRRSSRSQAPTPRRRNRARVSPRAG
jgi:EAL domain-containing protein (putative c-di-GMP-specific phosphodiesterase class I)